MSLFFFISQESSSASRTPSDTDEEPVAKLAKLSDKSEKHLSSPSGKSSDVSFFFCNSYLYQKADVNYNFCFQEKQRLNGALTKSKLIDSQAAGFDADSEGSDNEVAKPKSPKFNNPGTSNDLSAIVPIVVDQNMDTGIGLVIFL